MESYGVAGRLKRIELENTDEKDWISIKFTAELRESLRRIKQGD